MKAGEVRKIRENAVAIQLAVKTLFSNQYISRPYHNHLRHFLQDRLDDLDLQILSTLNQHGKAKFLAARFRKYLAVER